MCEHKKVFCINHYEIIRKYKCQTCEEVMMCACEEEFAKRFLPHQIGEGQEHGTRQRILVTIGFQENICNTCRGLPEETHPKAEIYGMSSKVRRYYWREILFETTKNFADWALEQGYKNENIARQKHPAKYNEIEKSVIKDIQEQHNHSPKYIYQEESQNQVLINNNVEVIDIDATYVKTGNKKVRVLCEEELYTVEEFAIHYYSQQGFSVLETESIPFHTLFGIFMWILIQDPSDPQLQIIAFGERTAFEDGQVSEEIWTHLPSDFSATGYATRRHTAIDKHLASIPNEKEELFWLFDYWVEPSEHLRQYLWAHHPKNIETARKLIEILPVEVIHRILKYLVVDYWKRYTGWPDLLVYNDSGYFFVEVKSSKDKLSEDQKSWIYGNTKELKLPFRLMKIHRKHVLEG